VNITTSVSAITSQGESAAVWMQPGSTGDAGKAEVYVYGTDQGIPSSSTIIESGRRIYEPINNTDRAVLSAQNEYWIFYACCKNTGDTAEIVVSYDINYRKEIDVDVQDQTTDALVFKFFTEEAETTLASNTSLFDRSIVVSDATGFTAGKLLHLIDTVNERGMICQVSSTYVSGTTIPIDRPLDFAYTSGTKVILSSTDMAINASSSEAVFGIRTENYDVPESFHFTRIRFTCITATAPEIDEFGDLSVGAAGVVKDGITIRKKNTTPYRNLVTFNSNLEMQGLLGHWTPFSAFNPGTGKYGFFAEWVLAGQENQGVANKVEPWDELEIVFKENFSGLTSLEAVAIGHIVKI